MKIGKYYIFFNKNFHGSLGVKPLIPVPFYAGCSYPKGDSMGSCYEIGIAFLWFSVAVGAEWH